MRYLRKPFLALLCTTTLLGACDTEDTYDVLDIEVPAGYELSAGTSTLFVRSSKAYDMPASWVTGEYNSRFNSGDGLYDDVRTSGNTDRKNGAFFRDYGRVLHDQAIYGVEPEGKLHVDWRYETFEFPDGETYELAAPTYTITEWYADSIAPEDLFCTVRIPLRHVGMGQMMAIDTREIEALAARSNYPEYGISGRCNYITEKGVTGVGLSGNKAQHLDLTVELGFSSDMGVTNSRYPEEICEGQAQVSQGSLMGLSYDQLDISAEDMEDVDLYMQALGVPARRDVDDPQVQLGEQMFYQAKCHLCHTPTLHTRTRGSTLLMGTHLPWLGAQTIHPYSDFLLHDMGSEIMGIGLNDNYVSGLARGNEWRTTPLWGIGPPATSSRPSCGTGARARRRRISSRTCRRRSATPSCASSSPSEGAFF